MSLHNLNIFEPPSLKNMLCQVWLKAVHWFWDINVKYRQNFHHFATIFTFENGEDQKMKRNGSSFDKECFVVYFVKYQYGQMILGKNIS